MKTLDCCLLTRMPTAVCVLLMVWGLAVSPALAGFLSTDTTAVVYGRTSLSNHTSGNAHFNGDIEFAVYAPGKSPFSPDPSGGTQYVYAYEVFNTSTSSDVVTNFTVKLFPGAVAANITNGSVSGAAPYAYDDPSDPPGISPRTYPATRLNATSAIWSFDATDYRIPVGDHSMILTFTSPYSYQWGTASLAGSNTTPPLLSSIDSGAYRNIPTPVPEPATWLLLMVGAGVGLFASASRKRARL